jgi:hypothetical protein
MEKFESFIPEDVDEAEGIYEVGEDDKISEDTVEIPEWIPESERTANDAGLIAAINRGRNNVSRRVNFDRDPQ